MMLLFFRRAGLLLALSGAVLFTSCATKVQQEENGLLDPRVVDKKIVKYKNPFPAGTYEHFVASRDYPETYGVYRDDQLLKNPASGKRRIIICLEEQRGRLYAGNKVAMDFPVSTGIRAYPTYTGSYTVIGKKVDHTSNLYGKMYNADGKCINTNAESSDPVPEGGRYSGASMPYWQRLTNAGLGLHVGRVRRRPQSHGCIRLQSAIGKELFGQTQIGTPVFIRQSPESKSNPFEAPPQQKRISVSKPAPKPASSAQPVKKQPDPQVKPDQVQPVLPASSASQANEKPGDNT